MNNVSDHDKVLLYQWNHYSVCKINTKNQISAKPITFQINSDHPSFNRNKFSKICTTTDISYDVATFSKNISNFRIYLKTNKELLCENIKKYYDTNLKSVDQEIFNEDIQTILDFANQNEYKIRISRVHLRLRSRIKLANILEILLIRTRWYYRQNGTFMAGI